jgi:hypothetical protein
VIDPEPDKFIIRLTAYKAGIFGYFLENEDYIELGDGNACIHSGNLFRKVFFVLSGVCASGMINSP